MLLCMNTYLRPLDRHRLPVNRSVLMTPTRPIDPTTRRGAPAGMAGRSLAFCRLSLRQSFIVGGCWLGLLLLVSSSAGGQCFQPATNYGVGDRPSSVVVGDVNADGRADLITANSNSNNVSVRLGQGGRGFLPATNYGTGDSPRSVVVGDVNADGRADLITANIGSDNVSVLLGLSGGGFGATTTYGVGNGPNSVAFGDVNGDGRADLITANAFSNNVSVLLGLSGGGFGAATNYGVGDDPQSVALGDVNADGRADLITANNNSDNVSVLLGCGSTGGQCFQAASNYGVGNQPYSVVVRDVNADGRADLITANYLTDNVSVLLGQSGGGFGAATNYGAGDGPILVALGDVNADGRADLITANYLSDNVSVLLGLSGGGFGAPTNYGVGRGPYSVVVRDVNADGRADLITANFFSDNVSVLLGQSGGGFGAPANYGVGRGPNSVAVGDVNADGRVDIITANTGSDNVSVLLGQSGGGFGAPANYGAGDAPYSVVVGDVNADGRADLITANANSNNVSVLLGQSGGGLQSATNYGVGNGPFSVVLGDVNADGRTDLITANSLSDNVSVLLGQSGGGFGAATNYGVGDGPYSVALGDVNADGRPDLISANSGSDNVSVLLNGGIPVSITSQPPVGSAVCAGSNVSVSVVATGSGSLTYQWFREGSPLSPPQTSATLSLTNVQATDAGSYQVVITGSCNSVTSTAFSLSVTNPSVSLGNDGPLTCSKTSVTLSASSTTGGTYTFRGPQGAVSSSGNTASVSQPGTYTVTLTSGGCSVSATTTVTGSTNFPSVSLINNGPLTCAKPTVTLDAPSNMTGGTFAFRGPQGAVNSSGNTATVSSPGTYTVTLTSGGCSASATTTVTGSANPSPPILTPSATTTNQPISVTATGCAGTVNWLPQGGVGQANGSVYSLTQPGTYTLSATCSVGSCTSAQAAPLLLQVLPAGFAITSVSMVNCQLTNTASGEYQVSFSPRYSGQNANPISFSVVNEKLPTTDPAPYTLRLYSDNPTITLVANQSGNAEAQYRFNWLAACQSGTDPNQAPTTTGIPSQTLVQDQGYALALTNYFADPDGQALTFSAQGLPAGLSLSGSQISGAPSTTGVSTISITALDPGGLSASTSFQLRVTPRPAMPSGFTLTGVSTVSCEVVSAGERRLTFTPQYAGVTGQPISFSVVNEKLPTTDAGPYSLNLYTDNPIITLSARQGSSEAQFVYHWLSACNGNARRGSAEGGRGLQVRVLGNPVTGSSVEVEISGVAGQAVAVALVDLQGRPLHQQRIAQAGSTERVRVPVGAGGGLLRVSTATQVQTLKVVKL